MKRGPLIEFQRRSPHFELRCALEESQRPAVFGVIRIRPVGFADAAPCAMIASMSGGP